MKPPRRTVSESPAAPRAREPGTFVLPEDCCISASGALKAALSDLVDSVERVTFDASEVRRIDTAGLQLLSTFARERRATSRPFAWSGLSALIVECADLLDLRTQLGLPDDSAAVLA